MASNLRRTEDLQRVKTRELVLQHTDGSYPTEGQVMVAGVEGRVEFTPVFSLDASGNMMVPGSLFVGGSVVTTGLYVNGPFSVDISHIVAGDLSAGSAAVGTLDASAATMTDLTVDRVHVLDYIDDADQISSLNTNLVRAVQVLAGSENPNDQPTVGMALDVSGDALVRGGLTVTGSVSVSGDLVQDGDVAIVGNLDVSGNLDLSGGLSVSGPVGLSGGLSVGGTVDVSGLVVGGSADITGEVVVGGMLTVDGSANVAGHLGVDGSANVIGTLYVGPNGDRGLVAVEDASGTAFKMRNLTAHGELFVADAGSGDTWTPILQCDATTNSFNIYDSSRNTVLVHVDTCGAYIGTPMDVSGTIRAGDICCNSITLLNAPSSGVLTYDSGGLKVNGVPVGGGASTTPLTPLTVAVGTGGPSIVYNASTNATSGNWSSATLPGGVSTVYCAEWNGKYWLALSNLGALHSLDGRTWTQKSVLKGDALPAAPTTATLASNGEMWLAGYSGAGPIYASTDGITWYAATTSQTATYGFFWTGSYWLALGTGPDPSWAVAKSIDGFTWAAFPTGGGLSTQMTTAYGMASDGSMNIVVGVNAGDPGITRVLYASVSNLTTWTPTFYTSISVDNTPRCITYNGTRWIIGGDVPQLSYSTDGLSWTSVSGVAFGDLPGNPILSVVWSGSYFIAVGPSYVSGSTVYRRYYSYDGISWFNSGASSPSINYTCTRSNNIWKTPPASFSFADILTISAANGGLRNLAAYVAKQGTTYL